VLLTFSKATKTPSMKPIVQVVVLFLLFILQEVVSLALTVYELIAESVYLSRDGSILLYLEPRSAKLNQLFAEDHVFESCSYLIKEYRKSGFCLCPI